MRKGAKFDRTLRNVLLLLNEKRRRGESRPYVVMQVLHLFEKGETRKVPEIPADFVEVKAKSMGSSRSSSMASELQPDR